MGSTLDLATWLANAPGVHVWLSQKLGKPVGSVQGLEAWWQGWVAITNPPMSSDFLLSGRGQERDRLIELLMAPPSVLKVQAGSKDEALAFIAAAIHSQPPNLRDAILSRTLLVETGSAWRQFSVQQRPLILIPRITDEALIGEAIQSGHHVVIPVGAGHQLPVSIRVPRLSTIEGRSVLEREGLPPAVASHAASLARRSLSAYRRFRAAALDTPPWATGENGPPLAPLLLAGEWLENRDGDCETLEKLSGQPYKQVKQLLLRWRDTDDPPFRQVGSRWYASAKEDAWRLLARFLSGDELSLFVDVAVEVLSQPNPKRGMSNDERFEAEMRGVRGRHSPELRAGIADSLAMLGMLASGDAPVTLADGSRTAVFATLAIRKLLGKVSTSPETWLDFAPNLPSLAEADPDEFLQVLEQDLQADHPTVLTLFTPQPGFLSPDYEYPHLLWALEQLAWSPSYFTRVALVLARLDAVAPKTEILNSPANTLLSFFRLWLPQCGASFGHRLQTLDSMRTREPEVAWALMLKLLPQSHDFATALGGPGARAALWRDWPSEAIRPTHAEFRAAVEAMSDRLLTDAALVPHRWATLIPNLHRLYPGHFEYAMHQLQECVDGACQGF